MWAENTYIYLDHAATTSTRPEVVLEMQSFFNKSYGNPSSVMYKLGRQGRAAIENARDRVAHALNCERNEVCFTSGGTESNNWALRGITAAHGDGDKHIITSVVEHPAILSTCKMLESSGVKITYLPVNNEGVVAPKDVEQAINEHTILISIMTANNETGSIQPIYEIGQIAHNHGIYFHTDAVQAIGNVSIDVDRDNIDLLSLSAHKFGGPKGIGALFIRKSVNILPLLYGGGQEKGRRSGTENVIGIVGLGKAIDLARCEMDSKTKYLLDLKRYFIQKLQSSISDIVINGCPQKCLPGHVSIAFKGVDASLLGRILDINRICVSIGSACHSMNDQPSYVLKAMGLTDEMAKSTIRFSLGLDNTFGEIDHVTDLLVKEVAKARGSLYCK